MATKRTGGLADARMYDQTPLPPEVPDHGAGVDGTSWPTQLEPSRLGEGLQRRPTPQLAGLADSRRV